MGREHRCHVGVEADDESRRPIVPCGKPAVGWVDHRGDELHVCAEHEGELRARYDDDAWHDLVRVVIDGDPSSECSLDEFARDREELLATEHDAIRALPVGGELRGTSGPWVVRRVA